MIATQKKQIQQNQTLVIAFFSFIIIGLLPGILNVAWTFMKEDFNVTLGAIGLMLMSSTTARLFSTFLTGRIVDRIGIGRYLLLGTIVMLLATVSYTFIPSFTFLLIIAFISGFGEGVVDVGMNVFVSANYSAGPMNWLHAFFGIGATTGPLLVTFIVVNLGLDWRVTYLVAASLQATLLVIFLLTFSQWQMGEAEIENKEDKRATSPSIKTTLLLPTVLSSMVFFFIYAGFEIGTGQLANTLFTESRGAAQETSSFWISMYWGMFTVSRMIAGTVLRWISNLTMKRLSMFGCVFGAGLMWWNPVNLVGFIGIAIAGFAQGPLFAILISETPKRVGTRYAPTVIGFQMGAATIGVFVLPGIAGFLAQPQNIGLEFIALFLFGNAIAMLFMNEWLRWQTIKHSKKPL